MKKNIIFVLLMCSLVVGTRFVALNSAMFDWYKSKIIYGECSMCKKQTTFTNQAKILSCCEKAKKRCLNCLGVSKKCDEKQCQQEPGNSISEKEYNWLVYYNGFYTSPRQFLKDLKAAEQCPTVKTHMAAQSKR